jgi:MFS family permease
LHAPRNKWFEEAKRVIKRCFKKASENLGLGGLFRLRPEIRLSLPEFPVAKRVSTVQRSLRVNANVIYLMGFFHSFVLIVPIFVPLVQAHGLSMTQILQTQALYALTIACCEVPSGYIADIWGRRRVIIIGSGINGCGFLWLIFADGFGDFLIYEVLLGIGVSLISGADLALLYDSQKQLEGTEEAGPGASKALSRLISIEAAASGLAGIGAALLLLIGDMQVLIAAQAFCGFIPLILGFLLMESPRPTLTQSHSANTAAILEMLLRGKPVVLWTAFAIATFGLLAMYAFWVYQKYWEMQGIPIEHFGYIWALFALTVSVGARYASYIESKLGWRRLLIITAILPLIGLMGMAYAGGWVGVMFGFSIQLSRGMSLTLFYDALNRRIPGDFRATVNSLVSLAVRSLFIVTGPLLGWSLDTQGIRVTLLGLVIVFAPILLAVIMGLGVRIRRESGGLSLTSATSA